MPPAYCSMLSHSTGLAPEEEEEEEAHLGAKTVPVHPVVLPETSSCTTSTSTSPPSALMPSVACPTRHEMKPVQSNKPSSRSSLAGPLRR